MSYSSPKIISEGIDNEPGMFAWPVLVVPVFFYEAAAAVQVVAVAETVAGLAVALVAGAAVFVGGGKTC